MSQGKSGSDETQSAETCNVRLSNGDTCDNPAGDDGTCHHTSHTPERVADTGSAVEETDPDPSGDVSDVRDAWETIGAAFSEELDGYVERASSGRTDPEGDAERAAIAFARKVTGGNSWRDAFGPCAVNGCDRGTAGFDQETCDEHDETDLHTDESDTSEGSDGGTSLADLSPEQIEALPDSVVEERLS